MKLKTIHILALLLFIPLQLSFSAKAENSLFEIRNKVEKEDIKKHSVKKGETVYSIAKQYNISVDEIYAMNDWAHKGIKAGDKLKIPKTKINQKDQNPLAEKQIMDPSAQIVSYRDHIIETKQTLYSLGLIYNVNVEDILKANPGLTADNFQTGKTIKIPVYKGNLSELTDRQTYTDNSPQNTMRMLTHVVKKGETIYKISKQYNLSEGELYKYNPILKSGLKTGMVISIPASHNMAVSGMAGLSDATQTASELKKGETMRIGILMPFQDKNGILSQDKIIEYYNGFLLGVRELKQKGYNIEIYTFDTGSDDNTQKLKNLLGTNEIKNLHLLIGGISPQQISLMTDFSLKTGIKYVIPFGTKKDHVGANVFQMTTSHTYLYPKITTVFRTKYSNYNIVFVSEAGSDNNKADFVKELKSELKGKDIGYKEVTLSGDLLASLKTTIAKDKKNIIIPASSSETIIKKLLTVAKSMSGASISFFGYPDWQTYHTLSDQLHKYDSYIYSTFYVDEKSSDAKTIFEAYRKWYNKPMGYSFPRFGLLGYDTALYFMTALNAYGSRFDEHLNSIEVNTIQSSIFFEPDIAGGGNINTGVYFIRFKPDMSIDKTEYTNK